MGNNIVFFKGQFRPLEDAKVSIRAKALNYGLGCFEGIRAYWNPQRKQLYIFRCEDHYVRMSRSLRILGLPQLMSIGDMLKTTVELLRRNEIQEDTYIRPIAYVASELLSPTIVTEDNEFAIYTLPLADYLDTEKGVTARVTSWTRLTDNMIPVSAKPTAAYLNSALARLDAKNGGADEAIFLNKDGYVSEGSAEHIFLIRDGKFFTPSSEDDNLFGITRATVEEIVRNEMGREVLYHHIRRSELYTADEAFFCGTGAQVTPVTRIDDRPVGNGKPGPITAQLIKLYFSVVHAEHKKYEHWCLPVY